MKQKLAGRQQVDIYHDTIESIVAALEAKDIFTADHSRRVGDLTPKLCTCLCLEQSEREMFHMAAHVHDIGKIGIPDFILSKPGKLLPQEWELMMQHPQIGAGILNKSSCLHDIAEIVLHHHERWDGLGYSDGLVREDIPFGSRVIAVCDSVDAMLSIRAYRQPLSMEQCRREILKNSGVMYDPAVADSLILHWDEIVLSREDMCYHTNIIY